MTVFIFCCGECYEYKGVPIVCPRCGKRLQLPRKAETLGACEREKEERFLNDTTPTPLKG
jgi:hypothetical protein